MWWDNTEELVPHKTLNTSEQEQQQENDIKVVKYAEPAVPILNCYTTKNNLFV
jgi:hypothetical protein